MSLLRDVYTPSNGSKDEGRTVSNEADDAPFVHLDLHRFGNIHAELRRISSPFRMVPSRDVSDLTNSAVKLIFVHSCERHVVAIFRAIVVLEQQDRQFPERDALLLNYLPSESDIVFIGAQGGIDGIPVPVGYQEMPCIVDMVVKAPSTSHDGSNVSVRIAAVQKQSDECAFASHLVYLLLIRHSPHSHLRPNLNFERPSAKRCGGSRHLSRGYHQTSRRVAGTGLGSRAVERGQIENPFPTENRRASA